MTVIGTPQPGIPLNSLQMAAVKEIKEFQSERLTTARTRAEKWIAGLTALIGLMTTAVVVKGPESVNSLAPINVWWHEEDVKAIYFAAALMVVGGLLLGVGTFRAYSAAFGSPSNVSMTEDVADSYREDGARADIHQLWSNAIAETVSHSREQLKSAVKWTLFGTLVLAVVVVGTWVAPSVSSDSSFCAQTANGLVEMKGEVPEVTTGDLVVVPCP